MKNQLIAVGDRFKYEKIKISICLKLKMKYIHKIVKKLLRQVRWWIKLHFKLNHMNSRVY